jgi:hypothetical protein
MAIDGSEATRTFSLHNRRGDLVATTDAAGDVVEEVCYTPYGVPVVLATGDTDNDGSVDADDAAFVSARSGGSELRGELTHALSETDHGGNRTGYGGC